MQNDGRIESFLNLLDLLKVTEEQNARLITKITADELSAAITRLKPHRAPGSDGFNSAWYCFLKEALSPKLLNTFNWVIEKGKIPPSWREAVILVIPKEGNDKSECASYRPVSILNQDYKFVH